MKTLHIKVQVADEMNHEALKRVLEDNNIRLISEREERMAATDGKKLAEILEAIAENGGLESFDTDPSEWQREQRKDRDLPFRED